MLNNRNYNRLEPKSNLIYLTYNKVSKKSLVFVVFQLLFWNFYNMKYSLGKNIEPLFTDSEQYMRLPCIAQNEKSYFIEVSV